MTSEWKKNDYDKQQQNIQYQLKAIYIAKDATVPCVLLLCYWEFPSQNAHELVKQVKINIRENPLVLKACMF